MLIIIYVTSHISLICRVNVNCVVLLSGIPLQSSYWMSLLFLLCAISLITYCSASTTFNVQTCVAIHAIVNISTMISSILLVLVMHYIYGLNYPLVRSTETRGAACVLHSSLSIFTYIIPSTSLVLLTIIHYRAIFWAKFDDKLQIKHLLYLTLVIWSATLAFTILWTIFHGDYSSWYCLPFTSAFSWLHTILQSIISIVCMASMAFTVVGYGKIVKHLHSEEKIVKSMRSTIGISHTKTLATQSIFTFLFHLAQSILMHTTMWLLWFGYDEWLAALTNIMYVLTVALTDVYLYASFIFRKMSFGRCRSKQSK